jgi:hypothetical protein
MSPAAGISPAASPALKDRTPLSLVGESPPVPHQEAPRLVQGPATDARRAEAVSPQSAGPGLRKPSAKAIPSWPLLLAAPATVAVWSGWVGLGGLAGFGMVHPFPGLPDLAQVRVNTAITLPVGVEAYGAYALRAWLATDRMMSDRTRRFARWSALGSLLLGMCGQVAYHLLSQAGVRVAPWGVTVVVASLPVMVLGMGAALFHMIRADAHAGQQARHDRAMSDMTTGEPAEVSAADASPCPGGDSCEGQEAAEHDGEDPEYSERLEIARVTALQLTSTGVRVSRRALRDAGLRGSNEELSAIVKTITAEYTHVSRTNPVDR